MLKNKEFIRSQREASARDEKDDKEPATTNKLTDTNETNEINETKISSSTISQKSPNLAPGSPITQGTKTPPPLERSITPNNIAPTIHQDDRNRQTGPCSWCFQDLPPQFFLPSSSSTSTISLFCSEPCFSQYRRAVFKQTKVCSKCKITITTECKMTIDTREGRQYFCSTKCQPVHTQKLLHISPKPQSSQELLLSPSQLLLAQAWLHSQIRRRNSVPNQTHKSRPRTSQAQQPDKPSLKVKPDYQLLEPPPPPPPPPPPIPRVSKTRRMAIRDQPARRFREMVGTDRRKRHREHKQPQQCIPKIPPPPPHFPLLPPPTLILPYPIFIPIPVPLFLPIPAKPGSHKDIPRTQEEYQELELCEDSKAHDAGEDNTVEVEADQAPLVVDIKQEEDAEEVENCETVVIEAEEGPEYSELENTQGRPSNRKYKKTRTCDEEIRKKRRALIMDR